MLSILYLDYVSIIVQSLKMPKMLIRDVPDEIRRALKIACAEEDISMNKKVIQLIEEYLKRKGKLD